MQLKQEDYFVFKTTKMANCTEDRNSTIAFNQANLQSTVTFYVFLSALNIALSITATLGNVLILIAFREVSSVHPPTKRLFQCLAVTDLCVGLIAQPLYATYIMLDDVTRINCKIRDVAISLNDISSFVLCGVSMFTSTAISVDRLLALVLGLRYRHVVTLRRVRILIACFWFISIPSLFLHFFLNYNIAETAGIVFVILSVVISVFSYTKIFLRLRKHEAQVHAQNHIQGQPNGIGIHLNLRRYKKTVSSIAWVQLALIACYVPYIISVIIIQVNGWNGKKKFVSRSAVTLVYLNSSLNPLFYFWKIGEVRRAVKNTIRQVWCCSDSVIDIDRGTST